MKTPLESLARIEDSDKLAGNYWAIDPLYDGLRFVHFVVTHATEMDLFVIQGFKGDVPRNRWRKYKDFLYGKDLIVQLDSDGRQQLLAILKQEIDEGTYPYKFIVASGERWLLEWDEEEPEYFLNKSVPLVEVEAEVEAGVFACSNLPRGDT